MFTNKDIEYRSIYVVNCIKDREMHVSNGELVLQEMEEKKTLTKLPFQKILALFIVGHIHITTPLIDKCKKYNVALVVVNQSFRPVFFWANSAEANYLLRKKQYSIDKEDISIAKAIIANKISNQSATLLKTRRKDELTKAAIKTCNECLSKIPHVTEHRTLMGLEGVASKKYFEAYYQEFNWQTRRPRSKCDALNATLDIGYTMLFNYIECFVRMFGFDPYIGVFHRLWFKRKSLICDLMEPFRCIIDRTIRTGFNRQQLSEKDFDVIKGEYKLKIEKNADYCRLFFDALVPLKVEVFKYVQSYYRCFMQGKSPDEYHKFELS